MKWPGRRPSPNDGSTSSGSGSKKSAGTILPVHTLEARYPTSKEVSPPIEKACPQRLKIGRCRENSVVFAEPDPDRPFGIIGWARVLCCKAFRASTNYQTNVLNLDGSDGSSSQAASSISAQRRAEEEEEKSLWAVEETVVDWKRGRLNRDSARPRTSTSGSTAPGSRPSSVHSGVSGGGGGGPTRRMHRVMGGVRFKGSNVIHHCLREAKNLVWDFFDTRFEDDEDEEAFRRVWWQNNKTLVFWLCMYLVVNYILYLSFNHANTLYEKIVFDGFYTAITLPAPFLIRFDPPIRAPWLWSLYITVLAWFCAYAELIQSRQCDFFMMSKRDCDGKDFLALAFYSTALPALTLRVCGSRIWTGVAMAIYFALSWALVVPFKGSYSRNVVCFAMFYCFILYLQYAGEMRERKMFKLTMQLKSAYRAQQRALAAESKANQAKRRFASYVFHEVRVPLNNALLAYQNLQASDALAKDEKGQETIEAYALDSSLQQMAQILNDVLDFHRMDAGGFESCPRPFCLHRAVRSLLAAVTISSQAKDLPLVIVLDPSFDDTVIVGDEGRLRQVLSNLCSNAIKFTPKGAGAITVRVKWLEQAKDVLAREDAELEKVVRFEVADCGPGIKPTELQGGRLFQPFVQTKIGKLSGKGTGLGLAIVRQIVTLSGGRLGVSSRKDEGAIFWFELPYPLATGSDLDQLQAQETDSHADPGKTGVLCDKQKIAMLAEEWGTVAKGGCCGVGGLGPLARRDTEEELKREKEGAPQLSPASGDLKSESDDPTPALMPVATPLPITPAATHSTSPPPHHPSFGGSLDPQKTAISEAPTIASRPSLQPGSSTGSTAGAPKISVLAVDDDPLTRTLMTKMLTKLGCEVVTRSDGQEEVDEIMSTALPGEDPSAGQKKAYDLVLSDYSMPNKTGEEAVRELRERGRTDYVVGCTGNALVEQQNTFLEAGVDRVLTKPIMLKDLKTVIETAKSRRSTPNATPDPNLKTEPPPPSPPAA